MKDVIRNLVKLQTTTGSIYQLEQDLEDIPKNVKKNKLKLEQTAQQFDQQQAACTSIESKIQNKQNRIDVLKGEIAKLKEKEKDIKTQREYLALDSEQQIRREEIAEVEKELEAAKAELNAQQAKATELGDAVTALKAQLEAEEADVSQRLEAIKTKLDELTSKRQELLPAIPRQILAQFDRIARNKGGIAIVPVQDGVCTGCNISLSPQVVNQIRRSDKIIYCLSCSRILYFENLI